MPILCSLLSCVHPAESPTLGEISRAEVQVVDLGHALNEANPYWPGDNYAPFQFEIIASLADDGVYSGVFSTPEHLGTHLDAPNHFETGQASVDRVPLRDLVAPAVVIDVRDACAKDPDHLLTREEVEEWERLRGAIPSGAVVFALTGWGRHWDDFARYKNEDADGRLHFPGFSAEAATFLVERRAIKGIGIDTLSVDYGLSPDFSVHHIVNGAGAYHLENVANLERIPARGSWVISAPIKIENGSGGPARVWAILPGPTGPPTDS